MTAGAVLFSTLVVPGTAHAETPTINSAFSSNDDWSIIDVHLSYTSEIDKVIARLRPLGSAETDAPVATITDFTQKQASATDGIWASRPVQLDALGEYTIDIEATNTAGETVTRQNTGVLRYEKQPLINNFSVTPTEPNIENKIVTAVGDLVARDPRTRTTEPIPDASVAVTLPVLIQKPVSTDHNGRFSFAHEIDGDGWASAYYQSDAGAARTPSLRVSRSPVPTRFVLDKSSFHVTAGDKITVAGTLEYQSGTQWKPLAGTPVELDFASGGMTEAGRVTTAANGRFSLSRRPEGDETYEMATSTHLYNSWIQHSTADVSVKVTATTTFTEFTATLNDLARLRVTGRLRLVGDSDDDQIKVDIQYSANGKTGWSTRKTVKTGFGKQFAVEDMKGQADGYWRLRYAGSTAKDIKASTSKVLRKNRALTRIKGANASPEPVRKGRTLTVTGVLQEAKPGTTTWQAWKAYGSRQVQIIFQPRGKKTWYLMGTVTTKANGSFSKGFKADVDGTWVPVFLAPDSKHFAGTGAEDYVDVR